MGNIGENSSVGTGKARTNSRLGVSSRITMRYRFGLLRKLNRECQSHYWQEINHIENKTMASSKSPQLTDFSIDILGRYMCNGLDEALHSIDKNAQRPDGSPQNDARPFNAIIIGGGSFGGVLAQHLLYSDKTNSHRILVLEAGRHASAGAFPKPAAKRTARRGLGSRLAIRSSSPIPGTRLLRRRPIALLRRLVTEAAG